MKKTKSKPKIKLVWYVSTLFDGHIFARPSDRQWTWEEVKAGCGCIGISR